jgi:glycosyltransferase involved in cell wall biosynthesis
MSENRTDDLSIRAGAKVLMLLTNAYDPDPRVRQEALALIAMGCNVHLLAWDRDCKAPASECMEDVQVERVYLASTHGRGSTQLFFYAWVYLKLLWRGWRTSFDVVHCHDLDTLPIGFVLARVKRKPVIYDAHESFPDMLAGSVPMAVRRGLNWLENVMIRHTDLLITVGETLRDSFEERGAKRSIVVGNWKRTSDFDRTPEDNRAVRRRSGIPDDALAVVCITQLHRERKIRELLEAVEGCENVYAIIGGTGALEPLVREYAARNPRIIYIGFVRGRAIADYTCAADVVYYGFDPDNPNAQFSAPNKLFEALAAGRPLITGDFGEIAYTVRRACCGFVLPCYTADEIRKYLVTLRDNKELRESLGASAKRYGQAFMNAEKAEEILHREYSALIPDADFKRLLGRRRDDARPVRQETCARAHHACD